MDDRPLFSSCSRRQWSSTSPFCCLRTSGERRAGYIYGCTTRAPFEYSTRRAASAVKERKNERIRDLASRTINWETRTKNQMSTTMGRRRKRPRGQRTVVGFFVSRCENILGGMSSTPAAVADEFIIIIIIITFSDLHPKAFTRAHRRRNTSRINPPCCDFCICCSILLSPISQSQGRSNSIRFD